MSKRKDKEAKELAARLEAVAQKVGGLRELSRQTEVTHTSLGRYINGEAEMTIETARVIAKGAGVSYDWLVTGKGPMSLKDMEGIKDLLAPKKLKNTFIDLESMYNSIHHFESKVRQKGKTYKPDEVASAVLLLSLIRQSNIADQNAEEIVSLIRKL